MVQECNLLGVASSDASPNFHVLNCPDALEAILAEHPGVEFRVIKCSDGEYVQFHRKISHGVTRSDNFYFVKLNSSS